MTVDIDELRRVCDALHPADEKWSCADCCPAARGRTEAARYLPACLDEIASLRGEVERLRNAVLRPMTEAEVVAALHEGHAKRRVAQGDNAWTTLMRQRDEARWLADSYRLSTEVERLKSGIRSAALTLVKWARELYGGNTPMAIVASNLRGLIGEPDLKEQDPSPSRTDGEGK